MVAVEAEVQGDPHIDQEAIMTMMTTTTEQRKWSSHLIMQEKHKAQHMMP